MSKTIELNGKRYDAVTGTPVKVEVKSTSKASIKKVTAPAKRNPNPSARKPQASKTLMRSTVKRPVGHGASASQKVATKVAPKYVEIPVKPAPTTSRAKTTSGSIFEQAIASSSHHRDVHREVRHHKKKVRNSRMQLGAGFAGLLLLAGFVAYQNTPGMQLQVAGMRAGVATASNPDYAAAGFAFGGVKADGSKRVMALTDDNGNSYQLLQEKTDWNEDDMLQALGSNDLSGVPNYTVVNNDDGSQVYRFENGTVTWIQNGVLHQVDDASNLSDGQLLSLAVNS